MARPTLYEVAGVAPTTGPAQIAASIQARLATADEDERELLLHARDTLLDPLSRESYDRLQGLRAPLTAEERAAYLQGQKKDIEDEEVSRHEGSVFAELFFTMYIAAFVLVLALWIVTMLYLVPGVAPGVTQILTLYRYEAYTNGVTILLLTVPYAILAYLVIHLFEKQMEAVGRIILIFGLNLALIFFTFRRYDFNDPFATLAALPIMIQIIMGSVLLMRYLGHRDLSKILGPRTINKRRK
ncbi:MAG: hypothetical protein H0T73_21940 [Ardenticatenales bacterium]|nr:hypothetical protein [Ardenticatenales bacterium]